MADVTGEDADENALVQATALAVLGAGLLLLFLGYGWFWMVFALGFAFLVPLVKLATETLGDGDGAGRAERDSAEGRAETRSSKRDALDSLRDRYARGELSDAAFERKVERLLETETLEDAREHVARGREVADGRGPSDSAGRASDPDDRRERERE